MAAPAPQTTAGAQPTTNSPCQGSNNFKDADLVADENADTDSAYGESNHSETTSLHSRHYRGYFENGRRYPEVSGDKEYYQPVDEQQWESGTAAHLLMLILDSQRSNTLFRSPVTDKWQHILDVGTGNGDWALDVADKYPNITVHAVDLYPPPVKWTAPNCIFEVDNITEHWTFSNKFDLVHLRYLVGSFSHSEWEALYRRAYDALQPGGWIEQVDVDVHMRSIDDSLPEDSVLNWGKLFLDIGEACGRPFDVPNRMEDRMLATGFQNVQRQDYKAPIGTWPQQGVYKDAGRVNLGQQMNGIEGWTMYLLTKHGLPTPWSPEEVKMWLAKVKEETGKGYRIYQRYTRVWAQKPFDAAEPKA